MGEEARPLSIRKISSMEQTTKKRIGYIDAVRGFAMILVVYFHISAYGFGSYVTGYNDILEWFRMPLFFFISGLLFNENKWISNPKQQIWQKFMALIVPTTIFMLLYLVLCGYFDFSSFGSDKKGYWFTFVLFEFFVIYIGFKKSFDRHTTMTGEVLIMIAILALSITAFYYAMYYTRYAEDLGIWKTILGLFSFVKIRHIIFFWFGLFVRRHFERFVLLTNKPYTIIVMIVLFIAMIINPCISSVSGLEYMAYFMAGVISIIVIFTIFRKLSVVHSSFFHLPSAILKYIGTHTLDIYLIHYFVLPYHIEWIANNLNLYENSFLCMLISLIFTSCTIAISLLISKVIRLNSFLAKYLLGTKG